MEKVGLAFEAQKNLEVYDEGRLVGHYIPDFIVEGKVIVEIKAFATLQMALPKAEAAGKDAPAAAPRYVEFTLQSSEPGGAK